MSSHKLANNNSLTNGVQLVKERNRSSNKVKLCGYLKKKRNKVGGWRKMWFVLQDKLLLSYTSKEEYDNKLVSFKDVLNLVPGTMVRPLGGFRFTIETTTHVMYTFHCDDRNAYREWITTLLDSLGATKFISATCSSSTPSFATSTLATYSLLPMQYQRFRNTSVDNIPHALYSNVGENSQRQRELSSSCDSMHHRIELVDGNCDYAYLERIAHNAKTINGLISKKRLTLMPTLSLPSHGYSAGSRSSEGVCVGGDCDGGGGGGSCGVGESGVGVVARLPIARSTAKILERNGINSGGLTKKHQQQQQQYQKRQQQQVNCCNRNNGTIVNAAADSKGNNNNNNNCNNNKSYDNFGDERFTTEASTTHFRLHGESATSNTTDEDNNGNSASSAGTCSSTISSSDSVYRRSINQSVLKINRMFQQQQQQSTSSSSTSEHACAINNYKVITNRDSLLYSKSTQTNCNQVESIAKRNQNNNQRNGISTDRKDTLLVDWCTHAGDDNNSADYSCCSNESKAMVIVKDQIQRMNIKGRKETISYANATETVDKCERKRIVVTKHLEEESLTESANMSTPFGGIVAKSKSLDNDGITNSSDTGGGVVNTKCNRSSEPIYAVVDLAHKYAQRQQRIDKINLKSLDANRCRSYESIIQGVEPRIVPTSRDASMEKSTCNLHDDDIDGIYEDGDKFVANCENNAITNSDEDENIYEPVGFHNISSQKINSVTSEPNTFWRYIARLRVNSLLQFTRMRRNNQVDNVSLHLPTTPSTPSPTLKTNHKKSKTLTKKKQPATMVAPTPAPPSQFSNIKHKFGAHRKSMQVRVRKMCARTDEAPKANYNNSSSDTGKQLFNTDDHLIPVLSNGLCNVGAVKKSKSRWKSVKIRPKHFNSSSSYNSSNCSSTTSTNSTTDDIINATTTTRLRFFGSLPHLRKTRVSLFSTPNLNLTAKDQNSNLSEKVGKAATADAAIVCGKIEYNN
ncbi:probable serine/threonine-protein kinase ndrD [Eurosta solidaginis]|uniref:probable serine/threonine-protein kinase ndrD n=1 Tax=Eurosta solidaginis TaxID=178769 RepID=UPI003531675A